MEKDAEYITLDNGTDYIILKETTGKNKYVYLVNENDPKDFLVQKVVVEDNEECFLKLDNDEEFEEAMSLFNK